jgi:hypothetical protein
VSPEQVVALLGALAAVLGALGIVLHNVAELRQEVNGRLQELLTSTALSAHRKGEMEGRDFMRRLLTGGEDGSKSPQDGQQTTEPT